MDVAKLLDDLESNTNVSEWLLHVSFTQIPRSFQQISSPWRVSPKIKKSKIINSILAHSLVVQSSAIPLPVYLKSYTLDYYIMTNACTDICCFLKYYLSWVGVEVTVLNGTFLKTSGEKIMHTFMEIENEIVDNTYIHSDVMLHSYINLQNNIINVLARSIPSRKCQQVFSYFTQIKTS